MGEFEMKRRNEEKGYTNHHKSFSQKKCFLGSKYSYSHFFIPLQDMQETIAQSLT